MATFEEMQARDIALGTGLVVGESLEERYAGIEGAPTDIVGSPEFYARLQEPVAVDLPPLPDLPGAFEEPWERDIEETLLMAGFGLFDIASAVETIWGLFDTAGDVYSAGQGLLQGEGDVSNGVDLYGHEGIVMNGGAVPVGGPGVPEPPSQMVARQWKTKAFSKTAGEYWVHFFRLVDGRMMCYNAAKREWKMWRPRKPLAVLYRGKTTLSQAIKVQTYLDKLWKTVAKRTKALKLA